MQRRAGRGRSLSLPGTLRGAAGGMLAAFGGACGACSAPFIACVAPSLALLAAATGHRDSACFTRTSPGSSSAGAKLYYYEHSEGAVAL